MYLFLIRHGETEHNIAGLLAGVTDSRLTNHGVLQTQRLSEHLIQERRLRFTHIYASDLQRAYMTANAICKAQNELEEPNSHADVVKLELLREQDFGSMELVNWGSRHDSDAADSKLPSPTDPGFRPKEDANSMSKRANSFLDDFVMPLFILDQELNSYVAVVSHGIFLGCLWRTILDRIGPSRVVLGPDVVSHAGRPLSHLPSWTNTGVLEIELITKPSNLTYTKDNKYDVDNSTTNISHEKRILKVHKVNDKTHLQKVKRARGGLGGVTYDKRQTKLESFFKSTKEQRGTAENRVRSRSAHASLSKKST